MVDGKSLQRKNDTKANIKNRKHSRNDLLEREKQRRPEQKLTFNITYYPAFLNFRGIMKN